MNPYGLPPQGGYMYPPYTGQAGVPPMMPGFPHAPFVPQRPSAPMMGMPMMPPGMGMPAGIPNPHMGLPPGAVISAPPQPSQVNEKMTTVFVGSIAEGVSDLWIERLLKVCGPVRSWKRVTDAQGKPKGFGFCVFETAESVILALRVLGGESESGAAQGSNPLKGILLHPPPSVGGAPKALLVKVDAVARKYADDHWNSVKGTSSAQDMARRAELARKDVEALLEGMKGADADSFLSTFVGFGDDDDTPRPALNPAISGAAAAAAVFGPPQPKDDEVVNPNKALPAEMAPEEREMVVKEISMFRESIAAKEKEKRELEQHEDKRRRERGRDDVSHTSRSGRRLSIFGDEDDDEELRKKQRHERDLQQTYLNRESRFERQEAQRIRSIQATLRKDEEREAKKAVERQRMAQLLMDWDDDLEIELGREDYYRDRDRWLSKRRPYLLREQEIDDRDRAVEQEELEKETEEKRRRDAARLEAQRAEEERRRLEEEERLRQERLQRELKVERAERAKQTYVSTTTTGVVVGRIMTVEERKIAIADLVGSIPAEREGLCNWRVKWDFLDQYVIANKIRPFVSKKVVEYLGSEDDDVVMFVMDKIKTRVDPNQLIKEMKEVLDDEAEVFVLKLWRMVVFESESRAQGLA